MSGDPRPWQMRVTGGLSAHFFQPDGSSRAGTDWSVGLKRGAEEHAVTVRTCTEDDLPAKLKNDNKYMARMVWVISAIC
ncbi:hypothetical protein sos41_33410 [Alphaproteobacteria bacterium SO-S41]|nr:hypothetical protein sos41_33410 [Alphaproteobacteria bacterium SO-S41]